MDVIDIYIRRTRERNALQSQLDTIKRELAVLEEQVIEEYMQAGRQSETRDGVTVYLRTDYYPARPPGVSTADQAAAILENDDYAWLVKPTVNSQTLRSHMLESFERDELGAPIVPKGLRGVVDVSVRPSARVSGVKGAASDE